MLDTIMRMWVGLQVRAQAAVAGLRAGATEREEGQTLVEYALILVLISIVVIIVLTLVGTRVNNIFNTIANVLQANT